MTLRASWFRKTFRFAFVARTSRGAMREKTAWFIRIEKDSAPAAFGLGEAAPLAGLSPEIGKGLEKLLQEAVCRFNSLCIAEDAVSVGDLDAVEELLCHNFPDLLPHPSLWFAWETALLDYAGRGRRELFLDNTFVSGQPIPINGLVWMDEANAMFRQAVAKAEEGFSCIKLKVGGLPFHEELRLIEHIRTRYSPEQIMLRLDANGSFSASDARQKLHALAPFSIHSIEQPLPPSAPDMQALCAESPIGVALDEELIGTADEERELLLRRLRPSFIVLKPTLHGGLRGCLQWVELARTLGIGWWVTSALESAVGLNAIAQLATQCACEGPQGLGTGAIYVNHFGPPLRASAGWLHYRAEGAPAETASAAR